ncbi:uncharacterized protein LOC122256165 isoform X7 [Penaeus japonicus]|uniref:uncharacterized protein LOC122256165 isoform X6 n=1 Tax=Penaeus japonicus TaxID=27405 RepID=UPI001C70B70B|nr:uncharacterized protein LOC122256165 isoform X6 [Penaeus japonicus]XP_042876600.1 uncharacterized protein LOC122256165 isoform X7 [Penaeus japonicus]
MNCAKFLLLFSLVTLVAFGTAEADGHTTESNKHSATEDVFPDSFPQHTLRKRFAKGHDVTEDVFPDSFPQHILRKRFAKGHDANKTHGSSVKF